MNIPISYIGDLQTKDVLKSKGIVCFDNIARLCTIVKPFVNNRGDKSPFRLQKMFGGKFLEYNTHFIIQIAGCALQCYYCYVDNKQSDVYVTAVDIVEKFVEFKVISGIDLKVLHVMGGMPARYCYFWPILRKTLDNFGLYDTIILSDVVLLENYFYKLKPWEYMDDLHHFVLTGCLKGSSPTNFLRNTSQSKKLFYKSLDELEFYRKFDNFYLTMIGYNSKDLKNIYKLFPKNRIDLLKIINYSPLKKN